MNHVKAGSGRKRDGKMARDEIVFQSDCDNYHESIFHDDVVEIIYESSDHIKQAGDGVPSKFTPQAAAVVGGRRIKSPKKGHSKRAQSPRQPSSDPGYGTDSTIPPLSYGPSYVRCNPLPFISPRYVTLHQWQPAIHANPPNNDKNGQIRFKSQESPASSCNAANLLTSPEPVTIAPHKDSPPPPKNVSLKFNDDGDLVLEWKTNHSRKCSYHVNVYNSTNELAFEEQTEMMHYEIPKDKCNPMMQYYATVSACNIGDNEESESVQTEKVMLCKQLEDSNVYADKSSPLKTGYQVYTGYIKGPKDVCEKVAVKFVEGRYLREVQTLMDLGSMENVVTYKYSGEIGENFGQRTYIVMELCHEDNLFDMVNKGLLKNQPDEVKKVLVHIMRGLSHIHEKKILHRDLKPHNVLRSSDKKTIKICDFGLSKQMKDDQSKVSKSSTTIGTDGWGSPEHYGDSNLMSKKSDVFSAGLIYCYVLSEGNHACGDKAYRWKTHIIDKEPIRLPEFKCDEPVLAAELVSMMLQYDPNNRPDSAEVLSHPFFWNNERKLSFFHNVNSFIKGMLKKPIKHAVAQRILIDLKKLESNFTDWGQKILDTPNADYLCMMLRGEIRRAGKYKPNSLHDLIRYIRNVAQHYSENYESLQFFKKRANIWPFFSNLFPELLPKLFDLFNQHITSMEEIVELSDVHEVLTQKAEYVSLKPF